MEAFVEGYLRKRMGEVPGHVIEDRFIETNGKGKNSAPWENRFDTLFSSFSHIADKALENAFTGLMHRDMQSRNIMVTGHGEASTILNHENNVSISTVNQHGWNSAAAGHENNVSVPSLKDHRFNFIDFQSARRGPLQYDLASLFIDPYVELDEDIVEGLLEYCTEQIYQKTGFDRNRFKTGYRYCAVTRNLQMLGAFGHLTVNKEKTQFETYIPTAMRTLKNNILKIDSREIHPLTAFVATLPDIP
ncbi:MAG: hypothetical protein HQK65_11480 [Desulfamplus sp.]|nr:hypothetical protein [Desulfamplus sp.]